MTHPVEYFVFALLTLAVIGLGLVLFRTRTGRLTVDEMFLGNRTLRMIPLALSALASIMSSTGIIGFGAHFYAYGINNVWTLLSVLSTIPVTTHIIIPLLYRLKITSVFEVRCRFKKKTLLAGFWCSRWVISVFSGSHVLEISLSNNLFNCFNNCYRRSASAVSKYGRGTVRHRLSVFSLPCLVIKTRLI